MLQKNRVNITSQTKMNNSLVTFILCKAPLFGSMKLSLASSHSRNWSRPLRRCSRAYTNEERSPMVDNFVDSFTSQVSLRTSTEVHYLAEDHISHEALPPYGH